MLKDVSVRGRSSKQDGLVYGLAKCCRSEDMDTKRAAYAAVKVSVVGAAAVLMDFRHGGANSTSN